MKNQEAFLAELTALSLKYRIEIDGCGCCGSPSLSELRESQLTPQAAYARLSHNGQLQLLGLLASPPPDPVPSPAAEEIASRAKDGYTWDARDCAWRDATGSL